MVVLDASAILALLKKEKGWERVEQLLPASMISAVNYSEVITKLIDLGLPDAYAESELITLPMEIIGFDAELALSAGKLRGKTRSIGLSLGDRACLALAKDRGVTAITSDRAWAELDQDLGVKIELIR